MSMIESNFLIVVKTSILSSNSELIHCSCPGGFSPVRDGECRGQYATITKPWDDIVNTSISKCNEIQGQPVIIRNEEVYISH